jgi:WD40 repeat protein
VQSVAFSPDGKKIVSGSSDKIVRIWNAEAGTPIENSLQDPTHLMGSVATPIGVPLTGPSGCVKSTDYSPDGMKIAFNNYTSRTSKSQNDLTEVRPYYCLSFQ